MGGASSINVADSSSGIILTYGTHALVANATVSGEYTIATNFDGTTSNLYVDGDLITQTTPTIASGAKMLKIGEDYNGLIKNLKFWNYAKSFLVTFIAFHHDTFANSGDPYSDGSVTAAATAGHIFSDTDTTISYAWGSLGTTSLTAGTKTTYTWTPQNSLTNVDVLMVAGGGGGGGLGGGGGGGAGGLLYHTNQTLSGTKTIVIGNGGAGGVGAFGDTGKGSNGSDTELSGFTTVAGGGGGGTHSSAQHTQTERGKDGGSGGGGGHYLNAAHGYNGYGGSAVPSGQGFAGGNTGTNTGGGGGGGSGGVGSLGPNGNGGIGTDKSSIFGTIYGDSGWFASGGGGAGRSNQGNNNYGTASNGGGSDGTSDLAATSAQKHTGGGGGGSGEGTTSSAILGGNGGSGIVLIKY